jgi:tetratricopeptide (TPR) repeat protein
VSRIEILKEEARRFEQDEQWGKALDLYSKAIDHSSADDTPDIALFNRAGDLATKIGSAAQAVAFYERAVDFYMDAGLPNNAIAVCKKVMRNLPDRYSIHLKMGQIRARQGFITDARTSFVTYAERVQAAGDLDEALRALIEFVNLAPDDYEMCMMLAGQLEQNDRADDAITQYVGAYRIMQRQGLGDLADSVAAKVRKMAPDLDLEKAAADPLFGREQSEEGEDSEDHRPPAADEVEVIGPVDLPLMSFDDDDDDTQAAEDAAAAVAAEAAAKAAAEQAAAEAAEAAAAQAAEQDAAAAEAAQAAEAADAAAAQAAADAAAGDADEAAAAAAEEAASARAAEEAAAATAAQEAATTDAAETAGSDAPGGSNGDPGSEAPPETAEGYVDIGAVLLGENAQAAKKSTRFVVPYEEPTGDDQADFEKMLAQFREKVSENIDANDALAHYDLGTAYMEMGLLDEAISEFQLVLRGTSEHLATYEMLGQTFLQKSEPEAALRSLSRGLDAPCEIEEERVGIYYYIGLAHETMGDKDTALDFYDRVFAIDINFADVTERLRALRD